MTVRWVLEENATSVMGGHDSKVDSREICDMLDGGTYGREVSIIQRKMRHA